MVLSSWSGPLIVLITCKNKQNTVKVEPWSKIEKWKLLDNEGMSKEKGASGNASHLGPMACDMSSNPKPSFLNMNSRVFCVETSTYQNR